MKPLFQKKSFALAVALLALPLWVDANITKVFDLDIENVYNFFIDSTNTANKEVIFCFQTPDKIIKTDSSGAIISIDNNPYKYFTVQDGETLILQGHSIINAEGTAIADYYKSGAEYAFIAASSSGIYVFQKEKRRVSIINFLNNKVISESTQAYDLRGLCCSNGSIYGIQKQGESEQSLLTLVYEDLSYSLQKTIPINEPRGIVEYSDHLYIFSGADKALYKTESPLPPTPNITGSVADSLKVGSDTIYFYEPNSNFSCLLNADISPLNIDTVTLYSLTTNLFLQIKEDVDKRSIQSLVKQYLPDALFKWGSGPYDYRCEIFTNSPGLDDAIRKLSDEDAIVSVSKRYIRKDVKDLLDMYPFASEVMTYAFTNLLTVTYLGEETWEKANRMIDSLGLQIESEINSTGYYKQAVLSIPKKMSVVSVANQLHESGCFLIAKPGIMHGCTKKCNVQQIDHSNIPFYYGKEGSKKYLYVTPDGFVIKKRPETDKSQMESIIRLNSGSNSRITWTDTNCCFVKTSPNDVKKAMEKLKKLDDVMWVSEKYLDNNYFNLSVMHGEKLTYWGLDGRLTLSYKEGVSESVKKDIIDQYGLSFISNYTIDDIIFPSTPGAFAPYDTTYYYSVFELPKTADVLSVCRSIYETGQVEDVKPIIVKERESQAIEFVGGTTSIKENVVNVEELSTQYFDLLGRKIDSPTGLTIVVTRYSDGTIRTEKKLFK